MKSFKLLLSVIALAVIAAAPVLRAEKDASAPAGAAKNEGPRGGDRLKALTEKLGLTEDQVAKIKPILKDEMEAMKALKSDASTDKKALREKRMEIAKSHAEQILAILTPEQQAKFKAMREEHRKGGSDAPRSAK